MGPGQHRWEGGGREEREESENWPQHIMNSIELFNGLGPGDVELDLDLDCREPLLIVFILILWVHWVHLREAKDKDMNANMQICARAGENIEEKPQELREQRSWEFNNCEVNKAISSALFFQV